MSEIEKPGKNRLANVSNKFQREFKKVLCVCTGGYLRSPTLAWVLGFPPFGFNTRAVGISKEYALFLIDPAHVHWADEIVVMTEFEAEAVNRLQHILAGMFQGDYEYKKVHIFYVEDDFDYRDDRLIEIFKQKALETWGEDCG